MYSRVDLNNFNCFIHALHQIRLEYYCDPHTTQIQEIVYCELNKLFCTSKLFIERYFQLLNKIFIRETSKKTYNINKLYLIKIFFSDKLK